VGVCPVFLILQNTLVEESCMHHPSASASVVVNEMTYDTDLSFKQ